MTVSHVIPDTNSNPCKRHARNSHHNTSPGLTFTSHGPHQPWVPDPSVIGLEVGSRCESLFPLSLSGFPVDTLIYDLCETVYMHACTLPVYASEAWTQLMATGLLPPSHTTAAALRGIKCGKLERRSLLINGGSSRVSLQDNSNPPHLSSTLTRVGVF